MYLSFAGLLNYIMCAAVAVTFVSAVKMEKEERYPEYPILSGALMIALIFNALELSVTSFTAAVVFNTLKFIGVVAISPVLLLLYLRFSGYSKTGVKTGLLSSKRFKIAISVIPVLTITASLTNPLHHLFWTAAEFKRTSRVSYIEFQPGIVFWVNSAFAYATLAVAAFLLLRNCLKKPTIYREQGYLMAGGVALAVLLNALVIFNIVNNIGDFSIIAFAAPAISHYWALYIYKPDAMIRLARSLAVTHLQNPIVIFDDEGLLIDANPSAEELFSLPENYFRTMNEKNFISEKLNFTGDSSGDFSGDGKEFIVTGSGGDFAYTVYDKKIHDKKGRAIGRVIGLYNITGIKSTVNKLEYMATHDHLTSLLNRNAFTAALHELPQQIPTAVISFCIYNIGVINQIYGYDRGDSIIRGVAGLISGETGRGGICGRISASEFCIALHNINHQQALSFAENIVSKVPVSFGDNIYVSVSYGIAVKTAAGDNIDIIVKKSNASMYHNSLLSLSEKNRKTISSIINTLKKSDDNGYFDKCAAYARYLKPALSLTDAEFDGLETLIYLSDIGLLNGASNSMSEKRGMLSNEEWEEMKLHTLKGHSIALSVGISSGIADSILSHHERYDGLGYPNRLSGNSIPKLARILSVITDMAENPDKSGYMLERLSGSKYDPEIAGALQDCPLIKHIEL